MACPLYYSSEKLRLEYLEDIQNRLLSADDDDLDSKSNSEIFKSLVIAFVDNDYSEKSCKRSILYTLGLGLNPNINDVDEESAQSNILEKKESSSSEVLDIILNTLEDPSLANNTIKCKISAIQLLAYVMEDGGDILINDTNYIERLKTIIMNASNWIGSISYETSSINGKPSKEIRMCRNALCQLFRMIPSYIPLFVESWTKRCDDKVVNNVITAGASLAILYQWLTSYISPRIASVLLKTECQKATDQIYELIIEIYCKHILTMKKNVLSIHLTLCYFPCLKALTQTLWDKNVAPAALRLLKKSPENAAPALSELLSNMPRNYNTINISGWVVDAATALLRIFKSTDSSIRGAGIIIVKEVVLRMANIQLDGESNTINIEVTALNTFINAFVLAVTGKPPIGILSDVDSKRDLMKAMVVAGTVLVGWAKSNIISGRSSSNSSNFNSDTISAIVNLIEGLTTAASKEQGAVREQGLTASIIWSLYLHSSIVENVGSDDEDNIKAVAANTKCSTVISNLFKTLSKDKGGKMCMTTALSAAASTWYLEDKGREQLRLMDLEKIAGNAKGTVSSFLTDLVKPFLPQVLSLLTFTSSTVTTGTTVSASSLVPSAVFALNVICILSHEGVVDITEIKAALKSNETKDSFVQIAQNLGFIPPLNLLNSTAGTTHSHFSIAAIMISNFMGSSAQVKDILRLSIKKKNDVDGDLDTTPLIVEAVAPCLLIAGFFAPQSLIRELIACLSIQFTIEEKEGLIECLLQHLLLVANSDCCSCRKNENSPVVTTTATSSGSGEKSVYLASSRLRRVLAFVYHSFGPIGSSVGAGSDAFKITLSQTGFAHLLMCCAHPCIFPGINASKKGMLKSQQLLQDLLKGIQLKASSTTYASLSLPLSLENVTLFDDMKESMLEVLLKSAFPADSQVELFSDSTSVDSIYRMQQTGVGAIALLEFCTRFSNTNAVLMSTLSHVVEYNLKILEDVNLAALTVKDVILWSNPTVALSTSTDSGAVNVDDLKITNADRKKEGPRSSRKGNFGGDFVEDDDWQQEVLKEKAAKIKEQKDSAAAIALAKKMEESAPTRKRIGQLINRARISLTILTRLAIGKATVISLQMSRILQCILYHASPQRGVVCAECLDCIHGLSGYMELESVHAAGSTSSVAFGLLMTSHVYDSNTAQASVNISSDTGKQVVTLPMVENSLRPILKVIRSLATKTRGEGLSGTGISLCLPILHAYATLYGQGNILVADNEEDTEEGATQSQPQSHSLMDCLHAMHIIGSRLRMDQNLQLLRPLILDTLLRCLHLTKSPDLLLGVLQNVISSSGSPIDMIDRDWSVFTSTVGLLRVDNQSKSRVKSLLEMELSSEFATDKSLDLLSPSDFVVRYGCLDAVTKYVTEKSRVIPSNLIALVYMWANNSGNSTSDDALQLNQAGTRAWSAITSCIDTKNSIILQDTCKHLIYLLSPRLFQFINHSLISPIPEVPEMSSQSQCIYSGYYGNIEEGVFASLHNIPKTTTYKATHPMIIQALCRSLANAMLTMKETGSLCVQAILEVYRAAIMAAKEDKADDTANSETGDSIESFGKSKFHASNSSKSIKNSRGGGTKLTKDALNADLHKQNSRKQEKADDKYLSDRLHVAWVLQAMGNMASYMQNVAFSNSKSQDNDGDNREDDAINLLKNSDVLTTLQFIVDEGSTDVSPIVRKAMISAGICIVEGFTDNTISSLAPQSNQKKKKDPKTKKGKGGNGKIDRIREREVELDVNTANISSAILASFDAMLSRPVPSSSSSEAVTTAYDRSHECAVILMGVVGSRLPLPDDIDSSSFVEERMLRITERMVAALRIPSQSVQVAVAESLCALAIRQRPLPIHADKLGTIIEDLLVVSVAGESYGERKGAAYGVAALVKGLGLPALKQHDVVPRMREAMSSGDVNAREGALFVLEALANRLRMVFEPYVITFMPILLKSFSHAADAVREAARNAAQCLFSRISAHGIKQVMSPILSALPMETQWKSRQEAVRLLGTMAHCAPRQLASALPTIVPRLVQAASDAHPKVKDAARMAMQDISGVIRNPEIKEISPSLLAAIADPANKTRDALGALSETEFMHVIDAPSLGLLCPVLSRALRDRSAEIKRRSCAITGNITSMVDDPKLLVPYLQQLIPGLKENILDAVPDVRLSSARALGTLSAGVGESETQVRGVVPWLLDAVTADSSSMERSGAAQGISELCRALGPNRTRSIFNQVMTAKGARRIGAREGLLWVLSFLPTSIGDQFGEYINHALPCVLEGLADSEDSVREVAMRSGQVIVNTLGKTHTDSLLPALCEGLESPKWRIRQSSILLLGDLLYLVGETRALGIGSSMGDDGEATFGQNVTIRVLAKLRDHMGRQATDEAMVGLYILRCDVSLVVRQSANQIWKSLVSSTPKTLIDLIDALVSKTIALLSCDASEMRTIAARALGESVRKLGDRVLPAVVPLLQKGLSSSSTRRRSACVGLAEILEASTTKQIESYSNVLVPALVSAICDTDGRVRRRATQAFGRLLKSLGASGMHRVLPPLLAQLFRCISHVGPVAAGECLVTLENIPGGLMALHGQATETDAGGAQGDVVMDSNIEGEVDADGDADGYEVDPLLEDEGAAEETTTSKESSAEKLKCVLLGIQSAVMVRPHMIYEYLIGELLPPNVLGTSTKSKDKNKHKISESTPPSSSSVEFTCDRAIALATVTSVCGPQLAAAGLLHSIIGAFNSILIDDEDDTTKAEKEKAFDLAAGVIMRSIADNGVSRAVDEFGKLIEISTDTRCKKLGCLLLSYFAECDADYSEFVCVLLRMLISRMCDDSQDVLDATLTALRALVKAITPEGLVPHLRFIQSCLVSTLSEAKHKTGAASVQLQEDKYGNTIAPLFSIVKSLDPLLPAFTTILVKANVSEREMAAHCIKDLVAMSADSVLKPFLIKTVGPLIRVMGEQKVASSIKEAVLGSLEVLLIKGGVALKPFVPQLQTTFVKAMSDQSRAVRSFATSTLALLMDLTTRVDPVINELCSVATTAEAHSIRASCFYACAKVVGKAGSSASVDSLEKLRQILLHHVLDEDEDVRAAVVAAVSHTIRASNTVSASVSSSISFANKVLALVDNNEEYRETAQRYLVFGAIVGGFEVKIESGSGINAQLIFDEHTHSSVVLSKIANQLESGLSDIHPVVCAAACRGVALACYGASCAQASGYWQPSSKGTNTSGTSIDSVGIGMGVSWLIKPEIAKKIGTAMYHETIETREAALGAVKAAGKACSYAETNGESTATSFLSELARMYTGQMMKHLKAVDARSRNAAERAVRWLLLNSLKDVGDMVEEGQIVSTRVIKTCQGLDSSDAAKLRDLLKVIGQNQRQRADSFDS